VCVACGGHSQENSRTQGMSTNFMDALIIHITIVFLIVVGVYML
jgi:hypothetical protein